MITANASNNIAVSLYGPQGLTIQVERHYGYAGDQLQNDGNHYTGGTYIHGGTVILTVPYAGTIQ